MDYNKVKLGLIDRFKVWRARRDAEKDREWFDKTEGEASEVDYSYAEQLQSELLDRKRIKKATRDAEKLFKRDNKTFPIPDKDKFIEQYLIDNGLKQKALPEAEETKQHSFMDKYPTEKTAEEVAYEQASQRPEIYYKIGNDIYKVPFLFTNWCLNAIENGKDSPVPLRTNDERAYFIQDDKMQPEDKYNMLKRLLDNSLTEIGQDLAMLEVESSPDAPFPTLCRQASYIEYIAKKLQESGKIKEAIPKLERMNEKIFKYNRERLEQEQENVRE